MANPWDQYVTLFAALNVGEEKPPSFGLPMQYTTGGVQWPVPFYAGVPAQFVRSSTVADPVIVPGIPMKATLLFEGNGGGWSESFYRMFPSGSNDPYASLFAILPTYIAARKAILSSSNQLIGLRVSRDDKKNDSQRRLSESFGMGPGAITGTPASLDQGYQVEIYDLSRQVRANYVYGGFAIATIGQAASSARDRPQGSTELNAWNTFLKRWFEPIENGYQDAGIPVIRSHLLDGETAPVETVVGWSTTSTGNLVAHVDADPGYERGQEVYLRVPRNRYVQGQGGTYRVLDSDVGAEDWEVELNTHPCIPTQYMGRVLATIQSKRPAYYATGLTTSGLYTRRPNGGSFFERRGRRSSRC